MKDDKNKVGRPRKFSNEEELIKLIDEYIEGENKDKLTITGLAIHLGFESRQSIYDYEKDDKFSYTIKTARLYVENSYEKALYEGSPTGAIFALKNLGWKDKTEIDQTNKNLDISPEEVKDLKDKAKSDY